MKRLIALCAAGLIAASAYAGELKDITISDLKTAIEAKKVTLIDVNGTDSWSQKHIPGAIDFQLNKEKLAQLLPKDKDALVVAYCGGPACSAYLAAAKEAKKLGYTNVQHLPAGISGWVSAGEKTSAAKVTGDAKSGS
jgi:rhodanese-related sulfurtransferase